MTKKQYTLIRDIAMKVAILNYGLKNVRSRRVKVILKEHEHGDITDVTRNVDIKWSLRVCIKRKYKIKIKDYISRYKVILRFINDKFEGEMFDGFDVIITIQKEQVMI